MCRTVGNKEACQKRIDKKFPGVSGKEMMYPQASSRLYAPTSQLSWDCASSKYRSSSCTAICLNIYAAFGLNTSDMYMIDLQSAYQFSVLEMKVLPCVPRRQKSETEWDQQSSSTCSCRDEEFNGVIHKMNFGN